LWGVGVESITHCNSGISCIRLAISPWWISGNSVPLKDVFPEVAPGQWLAWSRHPLNETEGHDECYKIMLRIVLVKGRPVGLKYR